MPEHEVADDLVFVDGVTARGRFVVGGVVGGVGGWVTVVVEGRVGGWVTVSVRWSIVRVRWLWFSGCGVGSRRGGACV